MCKSERISFRLFYLFLQILAISSKSFTPADSIMVSNCQELLVAMKHTRVHIISTKECIDCLLDAWKSSFTIDRNLTISGYSKCPLRWTTPGAVIRVQGEATLRFQNLTFIANDFKEDGAPSFLKVEGNGSIEFHNVVLVESSAQRPTHHRRIGAPCLRENAILFFNSTVFFVRRLDFNRRLLKQKTSVLPHINASRNEESVDEHESSSREIKWVVYPVIGLGSVVILICLSLLLIKYIKHWRQNKRLVESKQSHRALCGSLEDHRISNEAQINNNTSFDNIDMDNAKFEWQIGKGEHGCVYKAIYQGQAVAIKVIFSRDVESDGANEAYLARGALHPNVVRSYCTIRRRSTYWRDPMDPTEGEVESSTCSGSLDDFITSPSSANFHGNTRLIMMEFCDIGNLKTVLSDTDLLTTLCGPNISQTAFLHKIALDISKGMLYLHKKHVVHGDLKPQNILLQSCPSDPFGCVAKVGDFGLSRNMTHTALVKTKTCGSVRYMSPELLREGLLSMKTDVYSFGMVLWEMVIGTEPFTGKSEVEVMLMVSDGKRPHSLASIPGELGVVMRLCLQQDYTDRPGFDLIVATLEAHSKKQDRLAEFISSRSCHLL